MRNYIFIFLCLTLSAHYGIAQNLVPNYSFEIYDTCPSQGGQLYFATFWFQPNYFWGNVTNSSSSEYFNECTTTIYSVPNNAYGIQTARTGTGYAGMALYTPSAPNWREYVEVQLSDTLESNKKYCTKFYVSLTDYTKQAIDAMCIYFSQDSVLDSSSNYQVLPYLPQICNSPGNFLSDKNNWMKVSGTYTAQGGERFITIGNFNDDANTDTLFVGSGQYEGAYYYIDDVSVTLCTDSCQLPVAKFSYNTNELTANFYNLTSDVCADCNWFWYFGDGNTDTSENPVHIYDSAYTYTVTFVACNQTGCCNELCCDTMVLQVSVSVGLNELNNENNKLQIYPNPASGNVTIMAIGGDKIIITDIMGRQISSGYLSETSASEIKTIQNFQNTLNFSTDEIECGIYFLSLYSKQQLISREKFAVIK